MLNILGFPGSSVVKNSPASAGDVGPSRGREDPLEKEMAIYFSILAWEIPWTEEPSRLHSPWGCKRVGHNSVSKQQQQFNIVGIKQIVNKIQEVSKKKVISITP